MLVEHVVPATITPDAMLVTGLDLEMTVFGGRERTRADWAQLFAGSGFELETVLPVLGMICVIVGRVA